MTTVGPPFTATGRYRVVGTSPAHHDFVDKVKGSLHYAADWQLPGMLHGRIVRSPVHEHGNLPHPLGSLGKRNERPRSRRTPDNGDKFPSPHGALKSRTTPYHILE